MKKISLILIFVTAAIATPFAQQPIKTTSTSPLSSFAEKKNEMGIFGQAQIGNNDGENQALMGIQYKRWIKPNIGLRIMAGNNSYHYSRRPKVIENMGNDTVRVGYYNQDVNMIFGGLGIEAQRHFYKKAYLFASVDLIGGYGAGQAQTYSGIAPIFNIDQSFINNASSDLVQKKYSRAYIRILPSIGGKMVFKRFDFGLEMSAIDINWTSETSEFSPNRSFSIIDISLLGYTTFRLFLNYRF